MLLQGLSPEAHGVLQALIHLKRLRSCDEAVERELVAAGYATRTNGALRLIRVQPLRAPALRRQR
jgi:hypothetical protein